MEAVDMEAADMAVAVMAVEDLVVASEEALVVEEEVEEGV